MNDRRTFGVNGTTYADNVGILPPNLPINYEVIAHFADKSPAKATLTIKTADTHPVTNVAARVEENGHKVVVTWTNTANRFVPDYLYFAAVGGSPSQTIIQASATTVTLHDLPGGTHTYAILGYYTVPGVGLVDSNSETAPRFTVTIPHCVLVYGRAWDEFTSDPFFSPHETLFLAAGEARRFFTDWKYRWDRGTDRVRYGSHLRVARNDGQRNIELRLHHLIGNEEISVLKPGETKTYRADLARVTCRP